MGLKALNGIGTYIFIRSRRKFMNGANPVLITIILYDIITDPCRRQSLSLKQQL